MVDVGVSRKEEVAHAVVDVLGGDTEEGIPLVVFFIDGEAKVEGFLEAVQTCISCLGEDDVRWWHSADTGIFLSTRRGLFP